MRIRRVDQPVQGLWAISLGPPETVAVLAALPGQSPSVGALLQRPQGDKADGHVRGLRERLDGAELDGLFAGAGAIELRLRVGKQPVTLRADGRGLRLIEGPVDESLCAIELPPADDAILSQHARMLTAYERASCGRVLQVAGRKLRQRLDAIEQDDRRAADSAQLALSAQPLVAVAARTPRGAASIEATDWSSGEAVQVTLALDPSRTAREQLEEIFARARRMKRGEPTRRTRADAARRALAAVEHAQNEIAVAQEPSAVLSAFECAMASLPAGIRPRAGGKSEAKARPQSDDDTSRCARRYRAGDGTVLLVGRDARSNDVLTTRVARPHDIWMHARGHAGSHVVMVMDKGAQPGGQALIDAATLAAHFSSARGEDVVEVAWCERRYVRKPRGSAPGLVSMSREKTIQLRMESARLQRLLETVG
jgi:predicted ribosome quality control (RQC) complex YloA/Tae2 family protein